MISIVIAIRSLWACKILNGDKKIEVRKGLALYNALKKAEEKGEEVEFLMYVTKAKPSLLLWTSKTKEKCQKAILQMDEAQADRELDEFMNYEFCVVKHPQYFGGKVYFEPTHLNGKIVARFKAKAEVIKCYEINQPFPSYHTEYVNKTNLLGKSCLTEDQIDAYLQGRRGTALHISNIDPFDKSKTLADYGLKRAPQSWCYAKEARP